MILILFLISTLIATVAVTIALGLAVLVVYQWRKRMIALRAYQVMLNAYQSLALEQSFVRPIRPEPAPLFVYRGDTIH